MVAKHNQYKELLVRVRTGCVIAGNGYGYSSEYRWLGAFCFSRKLTQPVLWKKLTQKNIGLI